LLSSTADSRPGQTTFKRLMTLRAYALVRRTLPFPSVSPQRSSWIAFQGITDQLSA
jgi:hypothetical protein